MITRNRAEEIVGNLRASYEQYVAEYKKNNKPYDTAMKCEEGITAISDIAKSFEKLAKNVNFEGYWFPKFNVSVSAIPSETDTVRQVKLSIRTPINAEFKYNYKYDFEPVDVMTTISSAVIEVACYLARVYFANENLAEANVKLNAIANENEISSHVNLTLAVKDGLVADIDDTTITFNVGLNEALNLSTQPMFADTEYVEPIIEDFVPATEEELANLSDEAKAERREYEKAKMEEVDKLRKQAAYERSVVDYQKAMYTSAVKTFVEQTQAKSTPQIANANIKLIATICGKIKKRTDLILRKTYHTQAKYLGAKGGVGYVSEKYNTNGVEIDYFALLEKDADGNVTVKLSPFDIESRLTIDVDVLAEYNK